MKNLISIIIPIYNMEPYLERCINSVCAQTYRQLEIILVNDGSTDRSGEICEKYANSDERIRVIQKKNGGLSSARNAGLDVATGNYIGFLDSDDCVSKEMYEQLMCSISEDSISCNLFVRVDENNNIIPRKQYHPNKEIVSPKEYLRELLLHTGDVSVCTKLFSKELIGDLRFVEGVLNEDLLFMISILPHVKRVIYTGHIGYFYTSRIGSISNKYGKAIEDMVKNSVIVYENVRKEYTDLSEEAIRFALYQHMAYLLLIPKELAISENVQYTSALKFLREHFRKQGVLNKYLSIKNKLIIQGLLICPRLMRYLYQRKR